MKIHSGIFKSAATVLSLISISAFATGTSGTSSMNASGATMPTAQQQSNKPSDAELTRRIRADLMSRDLSVQAKNVTIVTVDGMVTLRGSVASAQEKATIGEVATRIAPNVRNDVVVKQ